MWNWVLQKAVQFLVSNLTEELIKEWAKKTKTVVLPWIRNKKAELIAILRKKAQESTNTLDDAGVDALDIYLEELLPDTPPMR